MIQLGIISFRYLELAVAGLVILMHVLLYLKARPAWFVWIGALSMTTLVVHLFLEDGRWQLAPLYLLLFLFAFWISRPAAQPYRSARPYRATGLVVRVTLSLVLVVALALPLAFPLPVLSTPPGESAVGVVTLPLPAAEEHRSARIWYPASEPGLIAAPYWSEADLANHRLPGFHPVLASHLTLLPTAATLRAPIIEAPQRSLPLLLLAPGPGWLPGDLSNLAIQAASDGWLVMDAGPIGEADALSLLAALQQRDADSALGAMSDPNRVVVLYSGDAAELRLGLTSVRLGASSVLAATLPSGAIDVEFPGAIIPAAALTQRHRLAIPSTLLVGGSDIAPGRLEEFLLNAMRILLADGTPSAPVFGGATPDPELLLRGMEEAIIRRAAAGRPE